VGDKDGDAAMKTCFQKCIRPGTAAASNSSVVFVEINNPVELYIFEPYCAMELSTGEWNTNTGV